MMENRSEGKQRSAKFLRRRKFLLVLPVLVLPFLLLLVWTLGLVGEVKATALAGKTFQGLNLTLPTAAPAKDSNWNKLNYYEKADKDSAKLRSLLKNDPYRERKTPSDLLTEQATPATLGQRSVYNPYPASKIPDANEERVYQKIAALHQQLDQEDQKNHKPIVVKDSTKKKLNLPVTDVDRLEKMMHSLKDDQQQEDPEMSQLNQMLEKIMDIQNPERVQQKIQAQSEQNKRQVFSVEQPREDIVSVLQGKNEFPAMLNKLDRDSMPATLRAYMQGNHFYGLDDELTISQQEQHAISAVIQDDQTLVTGATVQLRLLENIFIAGMPIPKDQLVYGLATLNGERLQINITSISYQQHILPVALSVYDRDGIKGINVPGAITRDVAKRSAAQSAQGLGAINTLDPSLGAQAVSAGLTMAQNLVGKSAKLVRVSVKAGYQVLLKDDNNKDK